jgi:hypothetical protein
MTRVGLTYPISSRLGVLSPYSAARPPVEEIEEDNEEARKLRREIQRRNGRGIFVDRSI